jgi:hypothetical protein
MSQHYPTLESLFSLLSVAWSCYYLHLTLEARAKEYPVSSVVINKFLYSAGAGTRVLRKRVRMMHPICVFLLSFSLRMVAVFLPLLYIVLCVCGSCIVCRYVFRIASGLCG